MLREWSCNLDLCVVLEHLYIISIHHKQPDLPFF
ncbi:unnamed protein product [Brassica napus]|uniref:(rape) hypothetical protein n=1 Tax=Brassica napus TaxID=3708 RepID=A0A816VGR7_BRANA|nr:unnamed protein product [Brassica napus]